MGLREKVALTIAVIMFTQVIIVICSLKNKTVKSDFSKQNVKRSPNTATHALKVKSIYPHVQGPQVRSKKSSDKSNEAIRKAFNFPDVEYPTVSPPRPHYYLQEANILQRNQIQRPADNPSSTTPQYSIIDSTNNMKYNNKKYIPAKLKTTKNPGTKRTFHEFGTTSKPSYYKEGAFPDVEYPLSAWETWKPNYWIQVPAFGPKNMVNNDVRNYGQVDTNLKSGPTKTKSVTFAAMPKFVSVTTPSPLQLDTTTSTTPSITPYTTLYFDTTTRINEDKDTISAPKKTKVVKKKNKKKKKKKNTPKYNSTSSHGIPTPSEEALLLTKTQPSSFIPMSDEPISKRNLNKLDTCSNVSNQTLSYMYVATTPSVLSIDDSMSTSAFRIHNDDKISCDNNVASISDTTNTVISENTDNKDSYFEDSVRNINNSSACDVDEEFTTDVFPDFDENMLSASTSTMSPLSLVGIDEAWVNSVVIDPYKSMTYPDELDQYYIALS